MKRNKNCCICDGHVELHVTLQLLQKYDVKFYRCKLCGFIQSEEPYWLDEVYALPIDVIKAVDSGRHMRATKNTKFMSQFIDDNDLAPAKYLDYGSGYEALFVNQMRQLGHNFYAMDSRYPPDNSIKGTWRMKYGAITSFEGFEHLVDPHELFARMAKKTNTLIIGTTRISFSQPPQPNWNYYNRRWGAHISFYTLESFKILGGEFGFQSITTDDSFGYQRTIFTQ